MRLGKPVRLERDGAAHDHRVHVQPAIGPVTLVAAHVGGDVPGFDDIRSLGLAGSERDVDQVVPLRDLEPVAIDDGLVLHLHGVDGATVLAEPDHQSRRRDGFRDSHSHQAEIGQIPAGFQGVLELDRPPSAAADTSSGRSARRERTPGRRAKRSPSAGRARRRRGTSRYGPARC